MDSSVIGGLEMLLIFGGLLLLAIHELLKVRREQSVANAGQEPHDNTAASSDEEG